MKKEISKTYSRKIVRDYQTWGFSTTLTETVEYKNKEEFLAATDKLFIQAKMLTEKDIQDTKEEILAQLEAAQKGEI